MIADAYAHLERVDPSPVVRLNRGVAVALAGDLHEGLELIESVDGLEEYHYLHGARADLLRRLGREREAARGVPSRVGAHLERGGALVLRAPARRPRRLPRGIGA